MGCNEDGTIIEETEEDFVEAVSKDHLLTLAAEKYIKENMISEDEINNYYKTDIYGEMHVRYILITPETTDEMTDEQKKYYTYSACFAAVDDSCR